MHISITKIFQNLIFKLRTAKIFNETKANVKTLLTYKLYKYMIYTSTVEALPFINMPPSYQSTIYTALQMAND